MSVSPARGRPRTPEKQEEQKSKLLDAARLLLREKSYKSITIRDLGATAGVNSAMVKYYFDSKEGLFIATIQQMTKQSFTLVQQAIQGDEPIKSFITYFVGMLNQDSGLARFIHDEVLTETSLLRDAFLQGFPSKMAKVLPTLVEAELQRRGLTPTVNTKYAAFNLMSMIMMPFLAAPIRSGVWQITDVEIADPAWIDHLYQQFIAGCTQEQ